MANELVVAGTNIAIPPATHQGFQALVPRLARLPLWFPPGASGVQLATAILAESNKSLLKNCTPESLVKCAFNAAVLGLPPGDFMGLCHFVPFKSECTIIVGYKGWIALANECDFLADHNEDVVLSGEEYERWTDENGPHFRHVPARDHDDRLVWDEVVATYCVWHGQKGGKGFKHVGRKELDGLKRKLEGRNNSVWKSNPIAMALKTPIHRAAKGWPRTVRLAHADVLDDAIDSDKPQPSLVNETPTDAPPRLSAFEGSPDASGQAERQPGEDDEQYPPFPE